MISLLLLSKAPLHDSRQANFNAIQPILNITICSTQFLTRKHLWLLEQELMSSEGGHQHYQFELQITAMITSIVIPLTLSMKNILTYC